MATTDPGDDFPFTVSPIPNKGYGCLATRPISPGEIILRENAIMRIPHPAQTLTAAHMTTAFQKLSSTEKTSVMALHEGTHRTDLSSQLLRIFKANTFGNGDACWLHPTISRFNHSCVPNATTHNDPCCLGDEAQIVAEKDIAQGEEICFSYNNELHEITTARQRGVLLRKQYGFACDCPACAGGADGRVRDARRVLIKGLRERLDGLQTSDFRVLEDGMDAVVGEISERDLWVKEVPLKRPLPASKRVAYNLLMGGLREAEGLPASDIAINYWHAAEAMLDQMTQMREVVVLQWARNTREWMERAIGVMERVRSPYDHESQTLRGSWKAMLSRPCLKVALGYLDGTLNAKVHQMMGVDDEEPFAIHITETGALEVLFESQFNELWESRDDISIASQEDEEPLGIFAASKDKLRNHLTKPSIYKVLGAALTCAAPVAAYWMTR